MKKSLISLGVIGLIPDVKTVYFIKVTVDKTITSLNYQNMIT